MNKAYKYCLEVIRYSDSGERFYKDNLLKRLRIAYRKSKSYKYNYYAWLEDERNNIVEFFLDWLRYATPKDLELEFNEHEIMELLTKDEED